MLASIGVFCCQIEGVEALGLRTYMASYRQRIFFKPFSAHGFGVSRFIIGFGLRNYMLTNFGLFERFSRLIAACILRITRFGNLLTQRVHIHIYTTIMELSPKRHSKNGFFGAYFHNGSIYGPSGLVSSLFR